MTLKRALLAGGALLVAAITLFHLLVNQRGGAGDRGGQAGEKFRVGHLPVT